MQSVIEKDGYLIKENPNNGPTLGFSKNSGVSIIEKDGLFFKDLSKTKELLPYEDWRLTPEERASDLASRLSIEEIAGLMLYSMHQTVPSYDPKAVFGATYDGKAFKESGKKLWDLSDQQKDFLKNDMIRHVLIVSYETTETAARWNNEMQSFVEALGFGIPVNTSSDPRHGAMGDAVEYKGTGQTSKWPEGLAMGATFDPALCKKFGKVIQAEYRALGITTALSPQADLATDPRWMRSIDTFSSHTGLVTDMTRAYCEGLQETESAKDKGWGNESVIAMTKHWPGGGPCEGGRDAHYAFGKYAVYPGNKFEEHLKPFLEGAFKLQDGTKTTGSIMPYYTVPWNIDPAENVGNSYSHYIIHDLLREKYGYDGVVCTDWAITDDQGKDLLGFGSRCYGVEHLSVAERHLKIIMNGVDQFGGNNDAKPIIEAYKIGCEKYGKDALEKRFRESAKRLLRGMFRTGLFENPYIDPQYTQTKVGCDEFVRAGYEAQLKAVVLLKNHNHTLPLRQNSNNKIKVYIPIREVGDSIGFFRTVVPGYKREPVSKEIVNQYFEQVEKPEDADVGIVFIESPIVNPYDAKDLQAGGNGYLPISLQYRPYTATTARDPSIAGGDPLEKSTNRTYRGKTVHCSNEKDLDNVLETRKALGSKPLIVICTMMRTIIPHEFEPSVDAFICNFGVSTEALFDTIVGKNNPSGLLPVQIPKSMEVVESHCEDVAFDVEPYVDSDGNKYEFGFGLSFDGVISDERNKHYHK